MKTQSLLTLLIITLITHLNAQESVTPDYAKAIGSVKFGLKGGVNFSTQDFKYATSDDSFDLDSASLIALHFGAFVDIPMSEKINLRPELLYSVEGSKIDLFFTEFEQKFTFIKLPVLISYRIINNLSIQAGPQFGLLIDEDLNVPVDDAEILDSSYKNFEFSAAIGLEYNLSEALLVGARYNIGLTDISDTSGGELKTNNLQLYLGWRLFK